MKKSVKELEQRKLMQEYAFIKADLEYKSTVVDDTKNEFMSCVYDKLGDDRKSAEEENANENELLNNKEKFDDSGISDEVKNKCKKLYREITKRTHPDKDVEGLYLEIYLKAVNAYEEYKIIELYECCNDLNIPYEMEEIDIARVKEEIENAKDMIDKIENSFVYLWAIYDNEKTKDILVNQFIRLTRDKL
jgi:hypothetical protein